MIIPIPIFIQECCCCKRRTDDFDWLDDMNTESRYIIRVIFYGIFSVIGVYAFIYKHHPDYSFRMIFFGAISIGVCISMLISAIIILLVEELIPEKYNPVLFRIFE